MDKNKRIQVFRDAERTAFLSFQCGSTGVRNYIKLGSSNSARNGAASELTTFRIHVGKPRWMPPLFSVSVHNVSCTCAEESAAFGIWLQAAGHLSIHQTSVPALKGTRILMDSVGNDVACLSGALIASLRKLPTLLHTCDSYRVGTHAWTVVRAATGYQLITTHL